MKLLYRVALAICLIGAIALILGVGGLFWWTPEGPCLGLMSQCFDVRG